MIHGQLKHVHNLIKPKEFFFLGTSRHHGSLVDPLVTLNWNPSRAPYWPVLSALFQQLFPIIFIPHLVLPLPFLYTLSISLPSFSSFSFLNRSAPHLTMSFLSPTRRRHLIFAPLFSFPFFSFLFFSFLCFSFLFFYFCFVVH